MFPKLYPQLCAWELFLNNKQPFQYVCVGIYSILSILRLEMMYNLGLHFFQLYFIIEGFIYIFTR